MKDEDIIALNRKFGTTLKDVKAVSRFLSAYPPAQDWYAEYRKGKAIEAALPDKFAAMGISPEEWQSLEETRRRRETEMERHTKAVATLVADHQARMRAEEAAHARNLAAASAPLLIAVYEAAKYRLPDEAAFVASIEDGDLAKDVREYLDSRISTALVAKAQANLPVARWAREPRESLVDSLMQFRAEREEARAKYADEAAKLTKLPAAWQGLGGAARDE